MITSLDEAKQLLRINKDALDEELERQSSIYSDISDCYVELLEKEHASKAAFEELEAALFLKYKTGTSDKLTVDHINALVKTDSEYIRQRNLYIKYTADAARWKGKTKAAEQKAKALDNLVYLFSKGYFGSQSLTSQSERYNSIIDRIRAAKEKEIIKEVPDENVEDEKED